MKKQLPSVMDFEIIERVTSILYKRRIMCKKMVAALAAVKLSSLAVLTGLVAVAGSVAFGDTLASWTINSNSSVNAQPSATTKDAGISSAHLALGGGVEQKNTSNTFGGDHFDYTKNVTTTFDTATNSSDYLEIAFTVSSTYVVSLSELSYNIRRAGSGPSTFQWVYSTDGLNFYKIGDEENPTGTTETGNSYTLDLSSITDIPAGTQVSLRIVAWGASGATGTFFFNKQGIVLSGTAEEVGGGDPIPLSVAVQDFGTIYAGVESSVPLTYAGDNAVLEISSSPVVAGTTNYVGGAFHFTPDAADIGTVTFTATVTDSTGANTPVSDTFTATVVERPFIEDFETTGHSGYYTVPTEIVETAATWQGTNFQISVSSNDGHNGARAAVFQASSGYIEMTTGKTGGVGSISFWHAIRANDAGSATASFVVRVSNNGGATWTAYESAPVVSSKTFSQTILENVNVGGTVFIRFDATCTHHVSLDDIIVTDYDGAATIDPAIGEIADLTIHADESCEIGIVFYGDEGLTKNVECITPGVDSGRYNLDSATGTFTYTPSLADLALKGGVISFNISLKEGEVIRASRSFTVTLLVPIAKWLELRAGSIIRENFDSIGGAAESALPAPWHVASTNALECFSALSYALTDGARDTTTQRAKLGAGTTTSGIYNLGAADNAEDRAVGFLSASSSANKFRTCALMVPLKNIGSSTVSQLSVQFTWEKWRTGRAKKLDVCYSTGAPDWVWTKIDGFHRGYDAEEGSTAFIAGEDSAAWAESDNDIERQPTRGKVNVEIPANGILYLGWFYSASEENSANAQVWAIDDVRIVVGNTETTIVIMQ